MFDQLVPSHASTIVFGRDSEIHTLSIRAAAARAGRSGVVILAGPLGMGKSSLIRAFLHESVPRGSAAADSGTRGMTVLHGTSGTGTATAPYDGVRALLRPLGLTGESAPRHPLLYGTARPALPALLPGPDHRPFTFDTDYPVLQGLYSLITRLAARRPVLLALDDAHLTDEHTLRWFDFLLRRADGLPLLLVLARSTETGPADGAWSGFAAHPSCTTVPLNPLNPAAVAEMVRHAFGRPVAPSFAARVADACGGNPGQVSRLLTELRRAGVRPDREGARQAAERGRRLLVLSLRTLFERNPGWVESVATAIAVLGEDLPDHVAALAGVSAVQMADAVRILRQAEVLTPGRTDFAGGEIRAAVLEPLGPGDLAQLHARAALLLSDAGRPAEEVAGHLLAVPGALRPWMASLLRDAAASAEGRGARGTAVRCLRRVLEAVPEDHALRLRLAGLIAHTDPDAAVDLLRDTLDHTPDLRTRAVAAVQYTTTCLAAGRGVPQDHGLAEILAELRTGTGLRDLAPALESALLLLGRADRTATGAAPRATARPPEPLPAPMDAVRALVTAFYEGSREASDTYARRVLDAPGPRTSWPVLASCTVLALADETTEALTTLNHAVAEAEAGEPGTGRTRALAHSARALVLYGTGAITESMADARAALDAAGRTTAHLTLPRLVLAAALSDRGEAALAQNLVGMISPASPVGPVIDQQLSLMVRARARRALGDHERALHLLLAAGRAQRETGLANPVFAPWWAEACHTLAALRRPREAHAHAEYGDELAKRWGTARALGIAALARGVITPGRPGIELLTEAAGILAASPARVEHTRAAYELGRRLLADGDQAAARPHLRFAADLAHACGALSLAHRARRLLIAAGGRMPELTGAREDLLTGAERKVVGLVLDGAGNREIAQSLCVELRTVETHLTSVYRKLGVSRRTALATTLRDPPRPAYPREAADPDSGRGAVPAPPSTLRRPQNPSAPMSPRALPSPGRPVAPSLSEPRGAAALLPHHSREQRTLSVLLDRLAAGRSAVVTLTGRPGYGQNALARWTARLGRSRGLRVLSARAVPSESGLCRGVAAQLLTALGAPGADRFAPVLRAARQRPLLVVVEDAQWTDPESLHWLHALVRRSANAPLAVVASGSDACVAGPDWRGLVSSSPDPDSTCETLLGPPSPAAAALTVRTLCGVEGEPEFTAAALRASAATPAVFHTTLRQFVRRGHLPVAVRIPELEALGRAALDDHIGRVLRGLPAETVAALRALAVGGGVLDFTAVCVLAGLGHLREARLRAVLDATGLVRGSGTGIRIAPEARLQILAGMEAAGRADLYAAAARLAHRAGAPDQQVAGLLLKSHPLGAAWTVHVLRRGSVAAQRTGDHPRAAAFLARALREPLDAEWHARLTLELAAAELVTTPEAGIRRLGRLARTRDIRSGLRVQAVDLGLTAGDTEGMRRAVAEARPAAAAEEQEAIAALFWAADPTDRDHAEHIVPELPPLPTHPVSALQAGSRAWQLALAGDGLTTARELARTALARLSRGTPVLPYLAACKALCLTGDHDEADAGLSTLLTDVWADGRQIAVPRILAVRAELNLRRGLLAAAEQDIRAAERALPAPGRHPAETARLRAVRIVVELERGDTVRARGLAAEPVSDTVRHSPYWPQLLFARAMVAAADHDAVGAVRLLRECGRLLLHRDHINPAVLPWRSAAARLLRATGQEAEAQRLSDEELRLARRWGSAEQLGWAELNAGPAPAHSDPVRARYAANLLRGGPPGPAYQRTLADLAAAELTHGGNRQAAAAALAELTTLTATHPRGPMAERARRLAAELAPGRGPGAARAAAWAELSPPEARTATLAARGLSNTRIAGLLSLSRRAVELRLSRVYRKLRIHGRDELHAFVGDMEGR
ncbi:AAA family ATPase [Streptomyces sp. NPDC094448]|uniref:AAA family ATPase n=1 Tax=Streptomyces sp. NPDC094448 TaxID=3366063 RepID=UPI00382D055A